MRSPPCHQTLPPTGTPKIPHAAPPPHPGWDGSAGCRAWPGSLSRARCPFRAGARWLLPTFLGNDEPGGSACPQEGGGADPGTPKQGWSPSTAGGRGALRGAGAGTALLSVFGSAREEPPARESPGSRERLSRPACPVRNSGFWGVCCWCVSPLAESQIVWRKHLSRGVSYLTVGLARVGSDSLLLVLARFSNRNAKEILCNAYGVRNWR